MIKTIALVIGKIIELISAPNHNKANSKTFPKAILSNKTLVKKGVQSLKSLAVVQVYYFKVEEQTNLVVGISEVIMSLKAPCTLISRPNPLDLRIEAATVER